MGAAMSGAFLLLINGHRRFAFPYARAMAHQGSGGVMGDFAKAKDAMDDYMAQVNDMKDMILKKTKITKAQFKAKEEKDWYMGAADMIKYGVVDEIVTDLGQIL